MAGALVSLLGSHPIATGRTAITLTANGNAQIDTGSFKVGSSSGLFDGTGDFITTGDLTTVLPNTSNFTLEFWVRFNVLPTSGNFRMIWGTTSSNQYWGLWNSSGTYRIAVAVTGTDGTFYRDWSNGGTPSTTTWYHYAMVKNGTSLDVYKDGTALTSPTSTGTMTANKGISGSTSYIGRWQNASSYQHNGWVDELRLSKTARYTANFTAPTSAFTNDSNTVLLVHFEGADGTTTFTDDNA